MDWFYVALGAALGANGRYYFGVWAAERFGAGFPYGTLLINVSGSFLIGLVAAFLAPRGLSANWRLLLIVGLLGGYTTFSSYSFEAMRLVEEKSFGLAALYLCGSPILGFGTCVAGTLLGRLMG